MEDIHISLEIGYKGSFFKKKMKKDDPIGWLISQCNTAIVLPSLTKQRSISIARR